MPKKIDFWDTPTSKLYNKDKVVINDDELENFRQKWIPSKNYLIIDESFGFDKYPYDVSSVIKHDKKRMLKEFNYDNDKWHWDYRTYNIGISQNPSSKSLPLVLIQQIIFMIIEKEEPPKCDIDEKTLTFQEFDCFGLSYLTKGLYCHTCSKHRYFYQNIIGWDLHNVDVYDLTKHKKTRHHIENQKRIDYPEMYEQEEEADIFECFDQYCQNHRINLDWDWNSIKKLPDC